MPTIKARKNNGQFGKGTDAWTYRASHSGDDKLKERSKVGEELGATGTIITSGYISDDDYNSALQYPQALDVYDQMRLGDATVNATLRAIKEPILGTTWFVEGEDEAMNEFIEDNLFNNQTTTWHDFMRQALLYLDYGHSVFEIVYGMEGGKIMIDKLAPRMQRTIVAWELSDGTLGVKQSAGDGTYAEIPIEKLIVFVNEKEGDNWNGRSVLRYAYKNWYMKDSLYKIDAIAHERQGIGIPIIRMPEGASSAEQSKAEELGRNLRGNEEGHFVLRGDGVKIEMLDMKGNATRSPVEMIKHHDRQISKSLLAQFLDLGASSSGSFALGKTQMDLFEMAVNAIARQMTFTINHYVVRRLVDLNFPNVKEYPKVNFAKISSDDMDGLAISLQRLAQTGLITPDPELEAHLRDRAELPEIPEGIDTNNKLSERIDHALTAVERQLDNA